MLQLWVYAERMDVKDVHYTIYDIYFARQIYSYQTDWTNFVLLPCADQ